MLFKGDSGTKNFRKLRWKESDNSPENEEAK